jgi:hypothetical protein
MCPQNTRCEIIQYHMITLVQIKTAPCETISDLNKFEQELFKYWSTESVTNKQYLQTQAYRTFRIHVLLNIQNTRQKPLNTTPKVSCHLSDNYILTFNTYDYLVTLLRNVDSGSTQVVDTPKEADTFDTIKY